MTRRPPCSHWSATVTRTTSTRAPEEERKAKIRDLYATQGSAYYSTARLWDDGVIDPAETRRVLGPGLVSGVVRSGAAVGYGVFRM